MSQKRIAIIGAGISGLGCAYALRQYPEFEITLYESGDHIGGHSNTVDFTHNTNGSKVTYGVDTGFLVFNRKTYPRLVCLFEEIKAPVAPSEMPFSVSIDTSLKSDSNKKIEWAGTTLILFSDNTLIFCRPLFGVWLMTSYALTGWPRS